MNPENNPADNMPKLPMAVFILLLTHQEGQQVIVHIKPVIDFIQIHI